MGNFILELPTSWNSLRLPTREELIALIPIALVLVILCIVLFGYRIGLNILYFAVAFATGYCGMCLLKPWCRDFVSKGFSFVLFTGVGAILVYWLMVLKESIFKKIKLKKIATFMITYGYQVLDTVLLFVILYRFVYKGIFIDIVFSVLIGVAGFFVQKKSGTIEREIRFYEEKHMA